MQSKIFNQKLPNQLIHQAHALIQQYAQLLTISWFYSSLGASKIHMLLVWTVDCQYISTIRVIPKIKAPNFRAEYT